VPAFGLKRRFADSVTIDLTAVEKIHGQQEFPRRRPGLLVPSVIKWLQLWDAATAV
jgi:hypothetical protein